MQDSENKPRSIDEVWERLVADARRAKAEADKEEYFLGIYDGCMANLAVFAAFLGRMQDYVALCDEFDDIPWLVEDADGNQNFSD